MDIGEEEKVHEIEPSEKDVAPREMPEVTPEVEPMEPDRIAPEPEKVPV